uniref:DUF229 domain-containing protein n=1 Tax=Glossina brevipalpis TaxID=37001 RepID=A0A1A9WBJ3_9MUSC
MSLMVDYIINKVLHRGRGVRRTWALVTGTPPADAAKVGRIFARRIPGIPGIRAIIVLPIALRPVLECWLYLLNWSKCFDLTKYSLFAFAAAVGFASAVAALLLLLLVDLSTYRRLPLKALLQWTTLHLMIARGIPGMPGIRAIIVPPTAPRPVLECWLYLLNLEDFTEYLDKVRMPFKHSEQILSIQQEDYEDILLPHVNADDFQLSLLIRNQKVCENITLKRISIECNHHEFVNLADCANEQSSSAHLPIEEDRNKYFQGDPVDIKSKAYFIDTPGCRILSLDVMNNQIKKYVKNVTKRDCGTPLLRIDENGSQLWVNVNKEELLKMYNVTKLKNIQCHYNNFKRKTDFQNQIFDCYYFINCTKLNDASRRKSGETDRLSVMILGMDGLSHLNFLRQMPKTVAFIRENLSHIEFFGYNKVEENTFTNLIPLLTGFKVGQLGAFCNVTSELDNCPIIWKIFKKAGYKTAYGEDIQNLTLFQYNRKGFKKQPTDFYFRTFALEMSKYTRWREENTYACYGQQIPLDMLLNYVRNLVPLMQNNDFFSFFWTMSATHDDLNSPQILDERILNLLKLFDASKILDRTVIFLMSDHGLRYGDYRQTHQGGLEDMGPLLVTILPKWFESKYSEAIKNMRINAYRLTTHFDVHATMADLINLEKIRDMNIRKRFKELIKMPLMPRSISLFLPIPDRRNCALANIKTSYCGCFDRVPLPINETKVQFAAAFIMDEINKILKPYLSKCMELKLLLIRQASFMSNAALYETNHPYRLQDIFVQLQTEPGLAIFEATVRNMKGRSTLSDDIMRINRYQNQSLCVDDVNLKKFCLCKD